MIKFNFSSKKKIKRWANTKKLRSNSSKTGKVVRKVEYREGGTKAQT